MISPQYLTPAQRRKVSFALSGSHATIQMGRSRNTAGFGTRTPVVVVPGDQPPRLKGQPYLKTHFSNGRGFSTTLYTPSTLFAEVGKDWLACEKNQEN